MRINKIILDIHINMEESIVKKKENSMEAILDIYDGIEDDPFAFDAPIEQDKRLIYIGPIKGIKNADIMFGAYKYKKEEDKWRIIFRIDEMKKGIAVKWKTYDKYIKIASLEDAKRIAIEEVSKLKW